MVEVLLAMVLTAVLMTALMAVATAAAQDRRRMVEREREAEPAWFGPAARLIESDLLMGSGVSGAVRAEPPGGGTCLYILTTNAWARPAASGSGAGASHTHAHLPVVVAYRLVPSASGGILLREEHPLTTAKGAASSANAARKPETQVVALGVDAVEIGGTALSTEGQSPTTRGTGTRDPSAFTVLIGDRPVAMQPIPPQAGLVVRVTMHHESTEAITRDSRQRIYQRQLVTQ